MIEENELQEDEMTEEERVKATAEMVKRENEAAPKEGAEVADEA